MLLLDWDVMRFGHLMHHRANRHDLDRPEDVKQGQSRLTAAPLYFFTLLGGGSIKAFFGPIAVFIPVARTQKIVEDIFATTCRPCAMPPSAPSPIPNAARACGSTSSPPWR